MNIIPFDSGKVPAAITSLFGNMADELVGNSAGGGFPVVSIKGKVFHISRGDDKTLVTKPGEDDPAASIEVVIIRANPNNSKVYYSSGYVEGNTDKPTCYSNSGVEPEADSQEPQSKKCATCAHNQWGARITDSGKKGKACSDSRRLAIATVDAPSDPMLLRVPAASMKALSDYGKQLAARGVPPQAVVTKIGFDYSVAHPALTFKPVGLLGDASLLGEIKKVSDSELVGEITGIKAVAAPAPAPVEEEELPVITRTPAPAPAPVAQAPKPATKRASPAATSAEDAIDAAMASAAKTVKAKVNVETPPAPAPTPAPSKNIADLEGQIGAMLDDMDFDD